MEGIDWSYLPSELLKMIVEGLTVFADYIRFRAVCKNWRSVTPPPNLLYQPPWLMLPSPCEDSTPYRHTKYSGDFFSLSDNRVYHIDLTEVHGKRCLGSSQGWLYMLECNGLEMSLFNPLTKAQIHLPPVAELPELQVELSEAGQNLYFWNRGDIVEEKHSAKYMFDHFNVKLILSENPRANNYISVIIYGEYYNMAFCRAGDVKWCTIGEDTGFDDVIYHQGKFYLVGKYGRQLVVCDLDDPCDPKVERITTRIDGSYACYLKYLVEVVGELMMVIRFDYEVFGEGNKFKTKMFYAYRFDSESKEWMRVTSLGDSTLFLGMNSSVSVRVKDVTRGLVEPNSIYFTDHYEYANIVTRVGGHDMGIFNLEEGRAKPLPCYAHKTWSWWIWPPSMWIS